MQKVDCLVIGAGVVGLSIAMQLGEKFSDVILVEKHQTFGQETSSRNSEVIHAGIYYPADSLKAKLCTEGKSLLYNFCIKNSIPFRKIGKLVIALKEDDLLVLETLKEKGELNGLDDLEIITEKKLSELEPSVCAPFALLSPSTGIIDTHKLMKCIEYIAVENKVMCAYGCEVKGIEKKDGRYLADIVDTDGEHLTLSAEILVNSGGLSSDLIAKMLNIDINKNKYRLRYLKGEYFKITGKHAWFMKHLVYPPPDAVSLGVHTVLDMQGQIKIGPSAFYTEEINYDVDQKHAQDFYNSTKLFLPFLTKEQLGPDMAGIRPSLKGLEDNFRDFIILHETDKGLPGFINLVGIDSPGLTSCLAIARYVENII